MDIRTVELKKLNPAPYNPRKDLKPGDPEYERLKMSIEEFGYVDPIVVNKNGWVIVGGHQRFKVLQELGYTKDSVSVVDLDDEKEKALNVVLNNPNVQGEWDMPRLEGLIGELLAVLDPQ